MVGQEAAMPGMSRRDGTPRLGTADDVGAMTLTGREVMV
jgi:hypothetical protein